MAPLKDHKTAIDSHWDTRRLYGVSHPEESAADPATTKELTLYSAQLLLAPLFTI